MTMTKIANMVNPEVLAPMVSASLDAEMKFTPLCKIDSTLVGQAGDTVTLPKFEYIGDAVETVEGVAMDTSLLTTSTANVTIKSAGKAVELTDKSVLVGYGDPLGECAKQIGMSIANKVDNDVLACLGGIKGNMTHEASGTISADVIADALVKFGENIDGQKVLLISPTQLATLRKSEDWIKATDIGADILIKGTVGMLHGCQVVVSNKITNANFIVKPEALAIYMKRDVLMETDRDILAKTTVISADKYYTVHLNDESKAIKITY